MPDSLANSRQDGDSPVDTDGVQSPPARGRKSRSEKRIHPAALVGACSFAWLFSVMGIPDARLDHEWHKGGSLHGSTAEQWQSATDKNKLATASDLVIRMYRDEHETGYPHGMDALKKRADSLVDALDEATLEGVSKKKYVEDLAGEVWSLSPSLRAE